MSLSAEGKLGPIIQLGGDDNSYLPPLHSPVPGIRQPVGATTFTASELSATVTAHNMRKCNEEDQDKSQGQLLYSSLETILAFWYSSLWEDTA